MTSIERYVGQSNITFIYDVTCVQRRVNECRSLVYEPRWSKIGSSKEIVGECKYTLIRLKVVDKMASSVDPYQTALFAQTCLSI